MTAHIGTGREGFIPPNYGLSEANLLSTHPVHPLHVDAASVTGRYTDEKSDVE